MKRTRENAARLKSRLVFARATSRKRFDALAESAECATFGAPTTTRNSSQIRLTQWVFLSRLALAATVERSIDAVMCGAAGGQYDDDRGREQRRDAAAECYAVTRHVDQAADYDGAER